MVLDVQLIINVIREKETYMYNKAAHMVVHPGFSTKAEQEGSASSQFFPPLVKVCILLHPPTLHRKLSRLPCRKYLKHASGQGNVWIPAAQCVSWSKACNTVCTNTPGSVARRVSVARASGCCVCWLLSCVSVWPASPLTGARDWELGFHQVSRIFIRLLLCRGGQQEHPSPASAKGQALLRKLPSG